MEYKSWGRSSAKLAPSCTAKLLVSLMAQTTLKWFRNLEETIQMELIGPDCYWKDPSQLHGPGYSKFFGNAW